MEEIHEARYGERMGSFRAPPTQASPSLKSPHVHRRRSSWNPSLLGLWRLHYVVMAD